MTRQEACRILKLQDPFELSVLKKRYRELMHEVHPDNSSKNFYPYDAREIIEAYVYLREHPPAGAGNHQNEKDSTGTESGAAFDLYGGALSHWNAPVNKFAYTSRKIFHEVEDEEGRVIGTIVLDQGKFYWSEEEEFRLFLYSLFTAGRELLAKSGGLTQKRMEYYQGELIFLLAKQFIDQEKALDAIVRKRTDSYGSDFYVIPAMLELEQTVKTYSTAKSGKTYDERYRTLYPSALRHHRLYLKNGEKKECGYLSFADDRLSFIIIPLFEDRLVQVRFSTDGIVKQTHSKKRYLNVTLEMKTIENRKAYPENINLAIKTLLEKAEREGKNYET